LALQAFDPSRRSGQSRSQELKRDGLFSVDSALVDPLFDHCRRDCPLLGRVLRKWAEQRPAILGKVAAAHARLICSYRPTVTALSGQEESCAILSAVESARDVEEFEGNLDHLALIASPR